MLYKVQGGSSIHKIMREVMREVTPVRLELITLIGDGKEELLTQLGEADFTIAVKLDAEMIAAARRLKLIQLAGVGFDGIESGKLTNEAMMERLRERGVEFVE